MSEENTPLARLRGPEVAGTFFAGTAQHNAVTGPGQHWSDQLALQKLEGSLCNPPSHQMVSSSSRTGIIATRGRDGNDGKSIMDVASRLERWDLYYLSDPGLLICRTCGVALWENNSLTHLRENHDLNVLHAEFVQLVKQLPLYCQDAVDVPHRPADLPGVPYLKIWDGYRCTLCAYAMISQRRVAEHVRSSHSERPVKADRGRYVEAVKVQHYSYYPFGNLRRCFAVVL